ncbi:hypothetical protein CACET_c29520 [Clostridium aceticum]|uniref:Uncharacterized protein n=1 Tax=Clostridium aceticum TaxID=84022 RepID=A0A0D8IAC2_9CLOT|nr:hypothetical protein [Clostridium aceticum]AKL96396.1 hypothetical protein CACET_c29520 [Clostridium aceticum]KJF26972.1 hypothetical protein TZ02_10630 [Clostridium aceticum]
MRKKIIYGLSLGIVGYFVYSTLKESHGREDKPIKNTDTGFEKEFRGINNGGNFDGFEGNKKIQEEVLVLQKRMQEMKRKINECKENLTPL